MERIPQQLYAYAFGAKSLEWEPAKRSVAIKNGWPVNEPFSYGEFPEACYAQCIYSLKPYGSSHNVRGILFLPIFPPNLKSQLVRSSRNIQTADAWIYIYYIVWLVDRMLTIQFPTNQIVVCVNVRVWIHNLQRLTRDYDMPPDISKNILSLKCR